MKEFYTKFNGDYCKAWLTKENYFDIVSTVSRPTSGYLRMVIENEKPQEVPVGKKLVRVLREDGDVIRKRYELFDENEAVPEPVAKASYGDLVAALRRFGVEV